MKFQVLFAVAFTLLAVSACVIEPIGGRGYHGGGYYDGGHHGGGDREYGRGVWRG